MWVFFRWSEVSGVMVCSKVYLVVVLMVVFVMMMVVIFREFL